MRWREGRRSSNVVDQRGMGGGGLPMGLPGGLRGSGMGGVGLLAFIIIAVALGVDPTQILSGGGTVNGPSNYAPSAEEDELKDFVSVVLADTEDSWAQILTTQSEHYRYPKLVLFSGSTDSACGYATAAVGPFYCPGDERVYVDLQFLSDLKTQFGAPGDFAQAYVIAHEVGHHVQKILGVMDRRDAHGGRTEGANGLSVRTELQADCFAGIWAHYADKSQGVIEPGDIQEALGAASAVGDDRLQKEAQGRVVPDTFTHGTSAQRARWFTKGYQSGELEACDTFSARDL